VDGEGFDEAAQGWKAQGCYGEAAAAGDDDDLEMGGGTIDDGDLEQYS
jgi:hypothetical protein